VGATGIGAPYPAGGCCHCTGCCDSGATCISGGGPAAAKAAASFACSAQKGQSVFEGGTSRPHCGHIQLNIGYFHCIRVDTPVRFHLIPTKCITTVLVALEFLYRAVRNPARVALFPGTWNPPTVAHVDIARMARCQADEVIWLLPRVFPHKTFEGAGFDARRAMVETLARHAGFSAAVSDGGLYAEMAAEARDYFGPQTEISVVLGRDAAERIVAWDYGAPDVFDDFVRRHRLLVADRSGEYEPAERHRGRISKLPMDASWDEVSSSEVRRRIANGEDWRALVPPAIAGIVQDIYREDLY
jgi:nicotinate-nucleotide adenylyltransferase